MDLAQISRAIAAGKIRVTDHADEEMATDALSLDDVLQCTIAGEIIEGYPTDYPLPSCLVYGQTGSGGHVHSLWAYNDQTGRAVLVTVYRPDPTRWINWRTRKK